MTDHSRRTFMTLAPIAVMATPSAGMGMTPTPHDPIVDWFKDWKLKNEAWKDAIDGPVEDVAAQKCHDLERLICTTQPTTREGAIAQLEYALEDFGDYMKGNVWHDYDAKLFANLLAGMKAGMA
jgi:hypothetical protein